MNIKWFLVRTLLVIFQMGILSFAALPEQAHAIDCCVKDSMPTSADAIHPTVGLLRNITFERNSANLNASSMKAINEVADLWRATPNLLVALSVSADAGMRPPQSNDLAKQRAASLSKALQAAGVAPRKLRITPVLVGGPPTD